MLTINIICIGKIKENFFKDSISEYSKRLSKYCKLKIIELNDEKIPDKSNSNIDNSIKEKESNCILNAIPKDSFTIALDLNGTSLSSTQFSEKIQDISMQKSSISFIIGGSLGLSQTLLNSVNYKICFSNMTFPHQLIRIFLLEQIYRGFKIANNETYHK